MNYKEMSNIELDEAIAKRVMGWNLQSVVDEVMDCRFLNWVSSEGVGQIKSKDYTPTTLLEQALKALNVLMNLHKRLRYDIMGGDAGSECVEGFVAIHCHLWKCKAGYTGLAHVDFEEGNEARALCESLLITLDVLES